MVGAPKVRQAVSEGATDIQEHLETIQQAARPPVERLQHALHGWVARIYRRCGENGSTR